MFHSSIHRNMNAQNVEESLGERPSFTPLFIETGDPAWLGGGSS